VSFKSFIFGRYKMIKKPLRTHAKSLSDALAPSKKKLECPLFARFWLERLSTTHRK